MRSVSDRKADRGDDDDLRVDGHKVWRQDKERVTNSAVTEKVYKSCRGEGKIRKREGRQRSSGPLKRTLFSSLEHGGRVHMDLVDLYLPECFTYHSDTE